MAPFLELSYNNDKKIPRSTTVGSSLKSLNSITKFLTNGTSRHWCNCHTGDKIGGNGDSLAPMVILHDRLWASNDESTEFLKAD